MIYIGMIFQYDSDMGSGRIMLSDGEQGEFNRIDWIDSENMPAVGQKISYDTSGSHVKIRVATEEDKAKALLQEEEESAQAEKLEFSDMDEAIKHFTDKGYKLLKDTQVDESRTASLRLYTTTDFGEASIIQKGSDIIINQTLNGKPV